LSVFNFQGVFKVCSSREHLCVLLSRPGVLTIWGFSGSLGSMNFDWEDSLVPWFFPGLLSGKAGSLGRSAWSSFTLGVCSVRMLPFHWAAWPEWQGFCSDPRTSLESVKAGLLPGLIQNLHASQEGWVCKSDQLVAQDPPSQLPASSVVLW
jgi:hypothetical protein